MKVTSQEQALWARSRRVFKATFLPAALLYGLALAVVLCITVIMAFYAYWRVEDSTSQYRRQMNAAAYDAQLFFDQREQLLRATAAAAVRNLNQRTASQTPALIGTTKQVEVLPLIERPDQYGWALVLTPRALEALQQMQVQLIYTSLVTGKTQYVITDARQPSLAFSAKSQAWIAAKLEAQSRKRRPDGRSPLVWLTPPMSVGKGMLMFVPVSTTAQEAGWVGFVLPDIAAALDLSHMAGGSYALYAPNGKAVVVGGNAPPSAPHVHSGPDWFGMDWDGSWFEYLVLSKSVGDAGWRLRYFMPRQQLIHAVLADLLLLLLAWGLVVHGIWVGCRYIHRRILQPAQTQVKQWAETVALNQALLNASPVGFALMRCRDKAVLQSNALAQAWLPPAVEHNVSGSTSDQAVQSYTLADGTVVQTTWTPLQYDGEPAVLCTLDDITSRTQIEQALRSAKQVAEQANQAKTVFLTTMSHEIRTPLYGVMGALELLSLTKLTVAQRQYLEALRHSSGALLSTLNNTLDLARIEAGHQPLLVQSFAPLQLLEEAAAAFATRAESKGLKLVVLVDASTPEYLLGDVKMLRQVLDNLINNAIKFTASGCVTVRLRSQPTGSSQVYAQFQVVDTGVGMAAEDAQRMFDPYFRAQTTSEFQGSGLGLSICARLAAVMHGQLKASSQPGVGTSVELALDLAVDTEAAARPGLQLKGQPVYVRGAHPEVVALACDWLRKWGAKAMPYRAGQREEPLSMVVETWPWAKPWAAWGGARVIAQPLVERVEEEALGAKTLLASAYSMLALGQSVRDAQNGHFQPQDPQRPVRSQLQMHLLVVEDNPVTRMVLTEQLQQLGCTVEVVTNGQEALDLPHVLDFDAIMTDLNMPMLSGSELAYCLREKGYAQAIIGLTANIFPHEKEKTMQSGISTLMVKPVSIDQLSQILQDSSQIG